MTTELHPYKHLPDYKFWSRGVARVPLHEVDPVIGASFNISKTERVATAGSCFAQHISRRLVSEGFNYYVTEQAHALMPPDVASKYSYGTFSARFGNIYTSRQLLQLLKRSLGEFVPCDHVWRSSSETYYDPYRPNINPGGFTSEKEFEIDRAQHLAAVRRLFESLDTFVFTLGLTEAWVNSIDGAVYPLCPGTTAGKYDPSLHTFVNFTSEEVAGDLFEFFDCLFSINPSARAILTVSPVPLVATIEDRHVLVSTTLSKSVLRVAADVVARKYKNVDYFPSFEIITGSYTRGSYFAEDLRSVTEEGVSHVMRLFLEHYVVKKDRLGAENRTETVSSNEKTALSVAIKAMCDEEQLDKD